MAEQNIKSDPNPKSMFRIVSMNEIFDQMVERERRWRDEKRVGMVSVDTEKNAVVIHFDATTEQYRYWFPLDKVKTADGQIQWMNHLRHKNWFTREVMNDFFDCLERLGFVKHKGL